jgi:hypothetical protein
MPDNNEASILPMPKFLTENTRNDGHPVATLRAVEKAAQQYAQPSHRRRERTAIEEISAWGKLCTYDEFMELTQVVCKNLGEPDCSKIAEALNNSFNDILNRDSEAEI